MSPIMELDAPQPATPPTRTSPLRKPLQLQEWLPALVLLAAAATAAMVYAGFWQHSRELWWWITHDRHTHYTFGLELALDLRTFDLPRFLHDFDGIRVWGPLHPVLVALLELVAGPDQRLAVLPSLGGWVLAMFCAYLLPRRMLPAGGDSAGLLAAFLVALSPAHRAFATDVMYESLGAGLSLAVLYLYLATVQEQTRGYARLLGLSLAALFLHKYNYWLLVVFGLVVGEMLRQPWAWLGFARGLCQRERMLAWLRAELTQPLNWLAALLAAGGVAIAITGGGQLSLGGIKISMTEPHNVLHAAYVLGLLRFGLWWHAGGSTWCQRLPMPLREVLAWQLGAMALWFLLPKRLSYFLWFLSPANTDQHRESVTFMHGLPHYLQALQQEYLTQPWALWLLGAMLVAAAFGVRRWKPGSAAVFTFCLIATYLTCQHPMLKNRFMHSWIAATWVLGACGLVFAAQQLASALKPQLATWAGAAAAALVMALLSPAFLQPGHAQEGGLKASEPSPLRITELYLPELAEAKSPTILSNVSARFLWTWTFLEHHRHQNVASELKAFQSYEGKPERVRQWLETTKSDALVLIDIHPTSPFSIVNNEYVRLDAFHHALAQQTQWTQACEWTMREGVTVRLWRRGATSPR